MKRIIHHLCEQFKDDRWDKLIESLSGRMSALNVVTERSIGF